MTVKHDRHNKPANLHECLWTIIALFLNLIQLAGRKNSMTIEVRLRYCCSLPALLKFLHIVSLIEMF